MRYHEPFDDEQLNDAVKTHAQMRSNLRRLRRQYPPRVLAHAQALQRYRDIIQEFGRELLRPHVRIDWGRLNELSEEAAEAYVGYILVRGLLR